MSQIEVDKVIPQSGTNLQLGDSGDTVDIPAGATLDATGATITGFDAASDEKITLKNPANLSSNIKEIYFASQQNAKKSILSADVAFTNWKSTSIDNRIGILKELMS